MATEDLSEKTPVVPTPAQLCLLRALVTEPTMEDVARRVGRSGRQTRRLVERLLADLGVEHARAAVALAASRGWIAPDDAAGIV